MGASGTGFAHRVRVGRLVLRQCDVNDTPNTVPVDVDALRIGPMVRDQEGELLVVALSADRTVDLPTGQTVRAVVRIGAVAMACPGNTNDVRAYDRSGTLRDTGTGLFP